MRKPIKHIEKGLSIVANGAWHAFRLVNELIPEHPSFTPQWSEKPLLKSYQKQKPVLGWPRATDSLCPRCVPEIRRKIVDGDEDYGILLHQKPGEIKAQIIERDGQILMVKDCPETRPLRRRHGDRSRVLPPSGRDIPRAATSARTTTKSCTITARSTIKHGRGSVLTVDLTNRCNMMCDPCFMDANQVGYVHELSWDEIKKILDNAMTIKPRRQMSVQFSGGEPTMSPYFLDAVRYARKIGYNSVQAATNGIEFAKSEEFCQAGCRSGTTLRVSAIRRHRQRRERHRKDRKSVRREAAGHREPALEPASKSCRLSTIVNGINNEQVGRSCSSRSTTRRRSRSCRSSRSRSRDAMKTITDERRMAQRYTLSHLAHDVKRQAGLGEPTRDWFPLSFMGTFSDWSRSGAWAGSDVGTGRAAAATRTAVSGWPSWWISKRARQCR